MKARTRTGLMLSAGAAATALTMAVAPTAAVAAQSATDAAASSIKAAKKAKISAKGAAVRIPITYTCNKGWEGYLNLQVVEVVGDGFASGGSGRSITCSGAAKTVNVYVQASAYQGSEPFEPGPASLLGSIDSYNPDFGGCEGPYACPVEGAKPATPPGGMIFTDASMPTTGQSIAASGSAHSEVQGTITLVK